MCVLIGYAMDAQTLRNDDLHNDSKSFLTRHQFRRRTANLCCDAAAQA